MAKGRKGFFDYFKIVMMKKNTMKMMITSSMKTMIMNMKKL